MLGILDWLKFGAGLATGAFLFGLYDRLIDDPAVRREALIGYVLQSEKLATEAQLAEERRRRLAAFQMLNEHQKHADAALHAERVDNERLEQEIANYEQKFSQNACRLDPAARDFLLSK